MSTLIVSFASPALSSFAETHQNENFISFKMNPLAFLPLLAAVAIAAPSGIHHGGAVTYSNVGATGFAYSAVAPVAQQIVHAAPVVQQQIVQQVQPVVANVQVPVTKTVHYETKPVVTGYSSSIIKPAIPFGAVAHPQLVPQQVNQVVVQEQRQVVAAAPVAPVAVQTNDAVIVEARSAPVIQQQVAVAAPVAVPVVRQAQAGDFGPLVTKEQVLAPVRTHTEITPQVTQIQPEVSVRRVINEVPVAQPVAVQTPVQYQVTQPIVQTRQVHQIAAPAVTTYNQAVVGLGHQVVGSHLVGQQVIGRSVVGGPIVGVQNW